MPGEITRSGDYTVAVALANPANVEQLLRTATDLAAANDGTVHAVSVVHKPTTSPFRLFADERIKSEFAGDHEAILERAADVGRRRSVPVQRELRVGSDVADAILEAVAASGSDALLIGWHGRRTPADVVLGTTIDPVVRRAPCDVYVERVGTTADGVDAVLLPTVGGPHVEAAANLARAVAAANDATVTVFSCTDGADHTAARDHVEAAERRFPGLPVESEVRETHDVADAIALAAADHDLVVLGATREAHLRERVVGSVAREVGRRVEAPIVIAKRGTGGSLFGRRLGRLWR